MAFTMMDFIERRMAAESNGNKITYDEWCNIRRTGTPEEIEEAVERMMAQGGYENLAD